MNTNNMPYYIGLMSGTSLDGIDAIIMQFMHPSSCKIIATHFHTIPKDIQKNIQTLQSESAGTLQDIGTLDTQMGELFAESVHELLIKANLSPQDITAIGSHGHTLWHAPNELIPFSWQIGNPAVIAQRTNIMTIVDFRKNDIACGGQGAPLTPPFHQWLFQGQSQDRIIVNIGGIANITVLTKEPNTLIGYDTGPGNGLLDAWYQQHLHKAFDKDGRWALQGECLETLLTQLLSDPYFNNLPPKSTGKEYFNLSWLEQHLTSETYCPQDIQATLLAFTAQTIVQAILMHTKKANIYLCGGGIHNKALVINIHQRLPQECTLQSTEALGLAPDWVEAACFAWLAKQRVAKKPLHLQTITGSQQPVLLGAIYSP